MLFLDPRVGNGETMLPPGRRLLFWLYQHPADRPHSPHFDRTPFTVNSHLRQRSMAPKVDADHLAKDRIIKHMNNDHHDSIIRYLEHYGNIPSWKVGHFGNCF